MSKTTTYVLVAVLAVVAMASIAVLLSRAAFARGVANGKATTEGTPTPATTVYTLWPLRSQYVRGYAQGCRPPAPPPTPTPTTPTT